VKRNIFFTIFFSLFFSTSFSNPYFLDLAFRRVKEASPKIILEKLPLEGAIRISLPQKENDLDTSKNYWIRILEKLCDKINPHYWSYADKAKIEEEFKKFMDKLLEIANNNLETFNSLVFQTWHSLSMEAENISEMRIQAEEVELLDIEDFFLTQLKVIEREMEERKIYGQRHNISQEREEIISEIKSVLEKFEGISGIIIFGSWTNGMPKEDSDVDILVISERGINKEWAEELKIRLEEKIGKKVSSINTLLTYQLIIDEPETFRDVFSFDENSHPFSKGSLYIKNFILIARNQETMEKIVSLLEKAISP